MASAARLDRENLLEYRTGPNQVAPVQSTGDWQHRRAEILAGMQEVMGALPGPDKRVPLDVEVLSETDCGSYLRREITYQSEPGSRVPAFLLVPKAVLEGTKQRPGVLALMSTDNVDGHRVTVGLGPANFKPGRNYGEELAWRGYVVIAPAYPLLARYQPDLKALGYQSGSMKGIWDNIRALDLLDATPGVSRGGYGAIGLSLGGHNAIFTAVLDERVRVVVSSCGFDSFLDYRDDENWMPGKGWTPERYMPRILDYERSEIPFDFHELVGALAPRAFLAIAARQDRLFRWQSVERIIATARQVYDLHGVPERLAALYPDCPHEFTPEMRQRAYEWIDRFLTDNLDSAPGAVTPLSPVLTQTK